MRVENVSKKQLELKAPGFKSIGLGPGKTHKFKDSNEYALYSHSAAGLKAAGWLKLELPKGKSEKDLAADLAAGDKDAEAQLKKAKMQAQIDESNAQAEKRAAEAKAAGEAEKKIQEGAAKARQDAKDKAAEFEKKEAEAKAKKEALAKKRTEAEAKAKVAEAKKVPADKK